MMSGETKKRKYLPNISLSDLKELSVFPVRILEPWYKFRDFSLPISSERLWILTNLLHALNDVLAGTGISKMKVSLDLNTGGLAFVLYDENGNKIYFDFISPNFPEILLKEIGFCETEIQTIKNKWRELSLKLNSKHHLLTLQPLNPVDTDVLEEIIVMIKERFNNFTVILKEPIDVPQKFLNNRRNQLRGDLVVNWLKSIKQSRGYLLGIIDYDIYIPKRNYVFYVQDDQELPKVGLLSLKRLHQEFYGLPCNRELFLERVRKQIYHIIGHFLGLPNCTNKFCVMSYPYSILDIDAKDVDFCSRCRGLLKPGRLLIKEDHA